MKFELKDYHRNVSDQELIQDVHLMAMMAMDFKAGDAVFTTPFTFFATVETIALTGATPVFADVEPDIIHVLGSKPKTVLPAKDPVKKVDLVRYSDGVL